MTFWIWKCAAGAHPVNVYYWVSFTNGSSTSLLTNKVKQSSGSAVVISWYMRQLRCDIWNLAGVGFVCICTLLISFIAWIKPRRAFVSFVSPCSPQTSVVLPAPRILRRVSQGGKTGDRNKRKAATSTKQPLG